MCMRKRIIAFLTKEGDYKIDKRLAFSWSVFLVHHLAIIAAGVIGFLGDPSPTVVKVLGGEISSYLWSTTFIIFGLQALVARIFRKARAEVVAVLAIAVARLLWCGILVGAVEVGMADKGTLQVAMAIAAGSFFMLGWSLTVLAWLAGWIKVDTGAGSGAHQDGVIIELRDQLQKVVEDRIETQVVENQIVENQTVQNQTVEKPATGGGDEAR